MGSLGPRTGALFESRTETWNKKNGEKMEESKRGAPKSAGPVAYAASAIWLIRHCQQGNVRTATSGSRTRPACTRSRFVFDGQFFDLYVFELIYDICVVAVHSSEKWCITLCSACISTRGRFDARVYETDYEDFAFIIYVWFWCKLQTQVSFSQVFSRPFHGQ
jgi:hypothetical protein